MNFAGRDRAPRHATRSIAASVVSEFEVDDSDGAESVISRFEVDDSDDAESVATIHDYAEDLLCLQRREHRLDPRVTDHPHREHIRGHGADAGSGLSPQGRGRRPVMREQHSHGGAHHPGGRVANNRVTPPIAPLRPVNRPQDEDRNRHAVAHARDRNDASDRRGSRDVRRRGPILPPLRGQQTQPPVIRLSERQQAEFWDRADTFIEAMGWIPRNPPRYQGWTQDPREIVHEAYQEGRLQQAGRPRGNRQVLEGDLRCNVLDFWLLRALEACNAADHGESIFEPRFIQGDTLIILVWSARATGETLPEVILDFSAMARAT